MIEIHLSTTGLTVQGHADTGAAHGQNIVCAAVSALTLTLMEGLEHITNDRITVPACEPGNAVIEWEELSTSGKALVDTFYIGILRIRDAYGHIMIV